MKNADLAPFYAVYDAFNFALVSPLFFLVAILLREIIYDHYDK